MTFRPKNNTKKELILSVATGFCAAVLFVISGIVASFTVVYQITALLLAVFAVELYVKYVANDYVYESTERELKIYKITGNKSICVASLDYEMSLSNMIAVKEYTKNKDSFPKQNFNVNYCKNLSPREYYVYFFEFNGRKTMMKFEPDDVFVNFANEKIEIALKNKENEEI